METLLAVTKNGIVENVIVINPDDVATIAHFGGALIPASLPVARGWNYDGSTFTPPVKPLPEIKSAQLGSIDHAYAAAIAAPIEYLGATFQADAASQALIAQVITASGGTLPDGFGWYDIDNNKVPMSFAQLQGLVGAILARAQPLFARKQTRKASIRNAATSAAVEAVTW